MLRFTSNTFEDLRKERQKRRKRDLLMMSCDSSNFPIVTPKETERTRIKNSNMLFNY